MARITRVKSARKKQPNCIRCGKAIEVGDAYYWWSNRIGRFSQRKQTCSDHYPRSSETTTSDKLSRVYAQQEMVGDVDQTRDSLSQALTDAAEEIRSVAEEYNESADNIEEGFGHETVMSEEIRDKANMLDDWASDIDTFADDVASLETSDFEADIEQEEDETDEDWESRLEQAMDERAQEIADEAMSACPL